MSDRRVAAGKRSALEAIRAGLARDLLIAADVRSTAGLRDVLDAAGDAGVHVQTVPRSRLDELARDHQGVVVTLRGGARTLSERDLDTFPFDDDAIVVILDGIEDPQNLGAAARSAEAAGASLLVTRTRRAAGVTPAAIRASAGALTHLPHARVANIARAVDRLHGRDFTVVGLDAGAPATTAEGACPSGPVALVIGSEDRGIARLVRERCDELVALPMGGRVGSLNASAALAAALWSYVLPSRRR